MEKKRLIIVDDDPGWVEQISGFLSMEPDFEISGTALTREDSFLLAKELRPDLVLMDIRLSGDSAEDRDGIGAAFDILTLLSIRSIMLTAVSEEECYLRSFSSGAISYVDKKDYAILPAEIRIACRQNSPFKTLLAEFQRLKRETLLNKLSKSERQVFDLFCYGLKRREIEARLFRSDNTIRNHIKSINKKLEAKSMNEAVKKIKRMTIIPVP